MSPERQAFLDMMIAKIHDEFPEVDLRLDGFGFILSDEKKGALRIEMEIPFLKTYLQPEQTDGIIDDWLSGFRQVVAGEFVSGSFDSVKNDLFLAVLPIQTFKLLTASSGDRLLAFLWPVTPGLAVYWAVDRGGHVGYVTKSLFESWGITEEEVTRAAYENTVRAEADMNIRTVPEGGILISSRSRFATIAHLLYWPANLRKLISQHIPERSNDRFLTSVIFPYRMMVIGWGNHRGVKKLQEDQMQAHGPLMSRDVYLLHDGELFDKVSLVHEGVCLVSGLFEDLGLVPERLDDLPYKPGLPREA